MSGIVSYGAYVPYWRLQRSAIAATLGSGGGKGTRSVASFDEDTTSMGVEAARIALRSAPSGYEPASVWFSTTAPAYLDKTNANAIHAALALPSSVPTTDVIGSVRSGAGAAFAARAGRGLAVLSDIRTGLPGGGDESSGGDAAVVFAFGEGPDVIAEPIASATSTAEFLDRWRTPGQSASRQWEERFGEHAYLPLVEEAVTDVLKSAGIAAADLDHVVLTGTHARAVKAAAKVVGARPEAYADDLSSTVGNAGSAQWGLVLAGVLDRAQPNQTIAVVTLADGCHVEIWRTTDAIAAQRPSPSVQDQIANTRDDLSYGSFLTWRGFLEREPPRRPEPDRTAAPPSFRADEWKYGFIGSRDESGFVYLPPARVSMATGSIDQMTPVRMADVQATVATFTIDRLAYSLSPPTVAAVIDFDGGGRFQCELTDVDPGAVKIGDRVEMTFRRLFTAGGVHNYFWKARPIRAGSTQRGQ
jgi:hydroxymethylglutaryl-CoA synthase